MKPCKNAKTILCILGLAAAVTLATSLPAAPPKADLSKLPPAAQKKDVMFDKDIKSIFDKSCVKCHSGDKPKGALRLDSRDNALKGGESGPVIVAGKSHQSHLVLYVADLVADMEMPPLPKRGGFPALTKEQVGLVRAWIDQGAK